MNKRVLSKGNFVRDYIIIKLFYKLAVKWTHIMAWKFFKFDRKV